MLVSSLIYLVAGAIPLPGKYCQNIEPQKGIVIWLIIVSRCQINEIFSNSYIAAQGPSDETIGLFWEMAWQKNVRVIVMLTNLIEGLGFNANKCSQYWPNMVGSSRRYQDIDVQLYDRQEAPDYLGQYDSLPVSCYISGFIGDFF